MYYNGYNDISVSEITFSDGRAKGLSALLIRNKEFECVVVKDHALDIAQASFCGTGVSFISRNKLSYLQTPNFAKNFEGGLLYTCGLDSVSNCAEGVYTHGTMHLTPAENVSYRVDDDKVFVYGDITTTGLFCDGITLHRELCISAYGVDINDKIENTRAQDAD